MDINEHLGPRGKSETAMGVLPGEEWGKTIERLIDNPMPPLGVIAATLTQKAVPEIKRGVAPNWQSSAYHSMMDRVDGAFKQRADYLLWRVTVFRGTRGRIYTQLPQEPDELVSRIETLLRAESFPVVVWGAIYVLARLLTQSWGTRCPNEVRQRIVAVLRDHVMDAALPTAPRESAAIRIAILGMLQQGDFHSGVQSLQRLEENSRHFDLLQQALQQVDLSWQLRDPIDVSGIDRERMGKSDEANIQYGIAPCLTNDFLLAILKTALAASASVRPKQGDDPKQVVELQQCALGFAVTAWRTARRKAALEMSTGETVKERDRSTGKLVELAEDTISTWRLYELHNLRRVARVARYAGKEVIGAAVAQAFMRLIDDEARNRLAWNGQPAFDFPQLGNDLAGVVRQYGLFVDERFSGKQVSRDIGEHDLEEPAQRQDEADDLVAACAASVTRAERMSSGRPKPYPDKNGSWPPYLYRVLADLRELDDWKVIVEAFDLADFDPRTERDPYAPIHKVLSAARHDNQFPAGLSPDQVEQCICAAHRLFIRYGQIVWAFKLLDRAPNMPRLLGLLDSIEQLVQRTPLAMHVRTYQDWRHAIRKTYRKEVDATRPQDAVRVHESLLGGTLGMRATAYATLGGSKAAMRALDKAAIRNSPEDTLAILDEQLDTIIAAGNIPRHLPKQRAVSRFRPPHARWKPVYASVARLSLSARGGRFAVIVSDGEKWRGPLVYTFEGPGAYKQKEALFETSGDRNWLKPKDGVPWSKHGVEGLRGLFDAVLSLSDDLGGNGDKWLLLNIDPLLAEVPWQELLSKCYKTEQIKLVSLVPGLRWLANRRQHLTSERRLFEVLDDSNKELRKLRELVLKGKRTRNGIRGAIIVGHGSSPNGNGGASALPSVTTGKRKHLSDKEWESVGQNEAVIAHVCSGGGTTSHRLGDLGYLPGYLLGMRTNLVCAPVIEIPITTAEQFQLRINESLAKRRGEEFGEVYLDAISRDKNIAFYSLYGLANQKLFIGKK